MHTLHTIALAFHILAGFTALTVGVIPMITKKGGLVHKRAGNIYVWAMYGVSLSTIFLFCFNPEKEFIQFLLCIGALSFYLTFTGARAITLKQNAVRFTSLDKSIAWITLGIAVIMVAFGALGIFTRLGTGQDITTKLLFVIFGTGLCLATGRDILHFSRSADEKMHWFFQHLTRILGAYIATFTAFCVVNVHFLPALVVWVGPGFLGGMVIRFLVKKYRKKFNFEF